MDLTKSAMKDIEDNSCVRFHQGQNDKGHNILIDNNQPESCGALTGYISQADQYFNVGKDCMYRKGKIIHELMHSIGFIHQHNAPEVDEYIKTNYNAISPGGENQFGPDKSTKVTDLGEEYDYESIMHYSRTAFGINGRETLTPLKAGAEKMGQRDGLSKIDIRKILKLYKCQKICGWFQT